MCQKCVDLVKEYFPELPEDDYGDFLMGGTGYPFGWPENGEHQLQELKKYTDGSVGQAMAFADYKLDQGHWMYKRSRITPC